MHEASKYRLLFSSGSNEHLAILIGKEEEPGTPEKSEDDDDDEGEVKNGEEKGDEGAAEKELWKYRTIQF